MASPTSHPVSSPASRLNPEQLRVTEHFHGRALVIAGPGSGKTSTITARVGQLLLKSVPPQAILCLTFTNKAALEMKERIARRYTVGKNIKICTFHALAGELLRRHGHLLGYTPRMTILDSDDQEDLLAQVARQKYAKRADIDFTKPKLRQLLYALNNWRESLEPMTVLEKRVFDEEMTPEELAVMKGYMERLQAANSIDFSGLLSEAVRLLRLPQAKVPESQRLLAQLHGQWRFIQVDEYQDTNVAQNEIVELLAGPADNVLAVGDQDQSIYEWRGANPEGIAKFVNRGRGKHGCATYHLSTNYRSTPEIIAVADKLIRHSPNRIAIEFVAAAPSSDKPPRLDAFGTRNALVVLAAGLLAIHSGGSDAEKTVACAPSESALLAQIAEAEDHMEPEELADRIMGAEAGLFLVDIRPAEEFEGFHIRGAANIEMAALPTALAPYKNKGLIVLYSNGMTHPAQARDSLARMGYANVYMLTDGLEGFRNQVLMPASLRTEPLSVQQIAKINSWRHYFTGVGKAPTTAPAAQLPISLPAPSTLPGIVEPAWLAENLGRGDVRILDVRTQPQYNTGHIPGSVCVSPEHFRGVVGGVSSMLLPSDILAKHMSLLGIKPTDTVVIVPDDKPHDATLVSMAFARLGQGRYGILNGGFARWVADKHPVTKDLPAVSPSNYPVGSPDAFTVDYRFVRERLGRKDIVIIDVRPAEFYTGQKVEEARGGHIPGAKNRPYTEDVTKVGGVTLLKSVEDLANAYAQLIPSKDTAVIVHCRTGHQASQTFFVLRNLLGYPNVLWYDGGWSEWAARADLPVELTP